MPMNADSNWLLLVGIAVGAYLLGSIPFGYILVRLTRGEDVRATGSGNIGATNVARSGGKCLGILTLVLDTFKGWLPVWLVLHLPGMPVANDRQLHVLAAGVALLAVLGHMFTIWLRFKGGKGVATGLGVFLALAPVAVLISVALFAIIFALTRYVSLGSIVAAASFPVILWLREGNIFGPWGMALATAVAVLVIVRHHQNIGRLLNGTESRFGARKA
jgi:glycerol-3-phosphate acyltransferase PlsY